MQAQTKIKLGATAGLRLLPEGKADIILAEVLRFLKTYPFQLDDATGVTITRDDEEIALSELQPGDQVVLDEERNDDGTWSVTSLHVVLPHVGGIVTDVGGDSITVEQPEKAARGLFAPLLNSLNKKNPETFELPEEVRTYFEGVSTAKNGEFTEAVKPRTR